tara:strand:+ start:363 stop:638 length:276 start_codon:yes stop_codon:yes gene_type:complete
MIGKLDVEEDVMENSVIKKIAIAVNKLGWTVDDNIVVEIGGSSVYGIDGAGTKWAPLKGTVKYNKDAFIVIKNIDRNPVVPSVQQDLSKGE